jgi:Nuclease-related domain
MTILQGIFIDISMIFAAFAIFIVTGMWKKFEVSRKLFKPARKSALSDNLLRNPGQYLLDQMSDGWFDVGFRTGSLILLPAIFVLFYSSLPASKQNVYTIALMGIVFFFVFMWPLFTLRKLYLQFQQNRIGYDGELATAQELNQLMRHGYYIYHDMQADKFNIDHIVIGPAGVFAIETKTRSKQNVKGLEAAKVFVNGNFIQYPTYQDMQSLDQASNQAKWLSDFLTKSVGKRIVAEPILALPGWMVERRTSETSVMVMNPKESVKFFINKQSVMDGQTIQQIKYQVEQKCRDLKPTMPI